MDKEKVKQFITTQRQSGVPDAEIYSFLQSKGVNLTEPQEKPDGLLKTIAKETVGTLLARPAVRATEALTRTFAPNSLAAKGYEAMADEGESQKVLGGVEVAPVKAIGEGGGKQLLGETAQVASYLFPYGKAAGVASKTLGSLGGKVASGATGGYLSDVGYGLQDETQTIGEALTPGLGTALGVAIPATGATLRGAGRLTKKVGEKAVDAVIPASTREAQLLQTYKANNPFLKRVNDVLSGVEKSPQTAGKTVLQKGLLGTKSGIGVQAKRASDTLWKDVISPKLKNAGVAVDLDGFFTKIQDDIVNSTDDITRQKSLLDGLQAIKDDYAGVNSISLEKLQKLKESWAKFLPSKAFKGQEIGGAVNEVRRLLSKEARETIYKTLGDDVKTAYLDYGNLQGLKEMGVSSMTGQKLKGGAGSFLSEALNQVVTPIGTVGGQGIYQVGKGIEFIGSLGAKNLGQALGIKLQFPGDKAVNDIGKRIKQVKAIPNKQGGFIRLPSTKRDIVSIGNKIENISGKSSSGNYAVEVTENVFNPRTGGTMPLKKQEYFFKKIDAENFLKDNSTKVGQDASSPITLQTNQTINKTSISPNSTTKSLKGKGTIPENSLISEARKYKSAEEFANNTPNDVLDKLREAGVRGGEQRMKFWEDATGKKIGTSYQMSHRPSEGVSAFNLTEKVGGEQMIPKDMYTQWYGSRGTPTDLESISVLKKIKGKPEADVTIYRASPKESFNEGDWVTFSKKYAEEHAKGNNTKVFSKVVKAKDVKWAMDDVNEFGYYPKSQLTDIWKKANKNNN